MKRLIVFAVAALSAVASFGSPGVGKWRIAIDAEIELRTMSGNTVYARGMPITFPYLPIEFRQEGFAMFGGNPLLREDNDDPSGARGVIVLSGPGKLYAMSWVALAEGFRVTFQAVGEQIATLYVGRLVPAE